jgi:hypothetical protein
LTHDNQTPAPPAGPAEQPAQDVSLSVLTMAYPAFRFSFLSAGFHRAKWLGLRRKPADPGAPAAPTTHAAGNSDATEEPTDAEPD